MKPLFDKFKTLFNSIPGTTDRLFHRMELTSDKICKDAPRPFPLHYKAKIQDTILTLLKNNIIRESFSPYCALVVFVTKKDGDIRIYIDYRKLNNITKRNAYPIPFINDVQNKLKGANIFSTIDLKSGYWQIPIDPRGKEKTPSHLELNMVYSNLM